MSKESLTWLNDNVLVGNVGDKSKWASNAWTYDGNNGDGDYQMKPWFQLDGYTGGFEGPIPLEAIEELFGFEAVALPVMFDAPCGVDEADSMDADGNPTRRIQIPNKKAIARNDTWDVLNIASDGYKIHQYNNWLVDNVANIIDDEVQPDSAGLLMGGGVAWVSVSLPESVMTAAEFAIRPRILAFTSHNGKYLTTYQKSVGAPVCDNSLTAEIQDGKGHGKRFAVKHTSQSLYRIGDARAALEILHQEAEEMTEFFDKLACWEVSNREFLSVLNVLEPMPDEQVNDDDKVTNKRALTMAGERRAAVTEMYVKDDRAAPWHGTGLGVLQAFNTFDQQVRNVRKGHRVERQMLGTLSGDVDKYDRHVLDVLADRTDRDIKDLVSA